MTRINRMNTDFFASQKTLDFLNHPKSCEAGYSVFIQI
jgi:hypothetical protein